MIRNCVGFLLGLSCLFLIEDGSQSQKLLIFSVLLCFLLIILLKKPIKLIHKRRFSLGTTTQKIARSLIAPIFGLIWGSFSATLWLATTPQLLVEPQIVSIRGYICSLPSHNKIAASFNQSKKLQLQLKFDFCLTKIGEHELSFYQSNKLRLSLYQASDQQANELRAGSYWQFSAKLKPIHGRLNPGGFDYEKWLVSEGFVGSGYLKSAEAMSGEFSLKAYYHGLRQLIFDRLIQVVPDSRSKGMILALAIGERSSIDAQQWQAIKDSGTSHLLAISGLHIGIAAIWSYYLCLFIFARIRVISRRVPAQKIAEIGSFVGALTITLLSGLGYPSQRALIMLIVYLVARWSGRHLSLANILSLSVIVIVLVQPMAILTVSFWLSILAVAIIVLLLSYKQTLSKGHPGIKDWLRINWFLFVGLMPITWVVFDSISVIGFVANLVLIPLTSFVTTPLVYLGLLSLLVSNELASMIFYLVEKLIWITYQLQLILSSLNSSVAVSSLPVVLFLLLFFATILILIPAKMPGKTLVLPIFLTFLMTLFQPNSGSPFKMVVFDIGQGLAIHIRVGERHLLYDTGYGNAQFSMAETSLIPYFKRQGITRFDKVIVSHADSDHAGGLVSIKKQFNIIELLTGEPLKLPSLNCHNAPAWQWQDVQFEFLHHLPDDHLRGNNASCVLQISLGTESILLTGDIEKRAERALLNQGLGQVDILVVPHHGSLTSSTEEFVSNTRPQWAIFSTGYANRWRFPKQEIVQRYNDIDAKVLVTHQNGAIIIKRNSDSHLEITTERSYRTHFWQIASVK